MHNSIRCRTSSELCHFPAKTEGADCVKGRMRPIALLYTPKCYIRLAHSGDEGPKVAHCIRGIFSVACAPVECLVWAWECPVRIHDPNRTSTFDAGWEREGWGVNDKGGGGAAGDGKGGGESEADVSNRTMNHSGRHAKPKTDMCNPIQEYCSATLWPFQGSNLIPQNLIHPARFT